MSETTLVLHRRMPAPVADVYAAWTDPAIMQRWLAPGEMQVDEVVCEPETGGRFRCVMVNKEGERYITNGVYKEVIPQRKLVHSWKWEHGETESLVTIEFEALNESSTRLTLTHERFPDAGVKDNHQDGWNGCLAKLETLVGSQLYSAAL